MISEWERVKITPFNCPKQLVDMYLNSIEPLYMLKGCHTERDRMTKYTLINCIESVINEAKLESRKRVRIAWKIDEGKHGKDNNSD